MINNNMKIALITGITGQCGSICAEKLLKEGYEVHGIIRPSSTLSTERIDHIFDKLKLHYGDLKDSANILSLIMKIKPTEIYNFAAQSHVKISAELEDLTIQVNTLGVLHILQAVRILNMEKTCRIYHASTSEEFGNQTTGDVKLNEDTPKLPVSIYGVSKLAAEHICNIYRDAYGMYVVSGTLFNNESERRGHNFVTQKISNYVGKYINGKANGPLQLGNLDSKRDWGYSYDYIDAIILMMRQETPDNYVISTGETHSVREFVEHAFKYIGIPIEWIGQGVNEIGINKLTGDTMVCINPRYFRDLELHTLIGDSSKAKKQLNWEPKTKFNKLVNIMVEAAINRQK